MGPSARYLRRKQAGAYLVENYGFGSAKTLAKLATLGGGPEIFYAGRLPLYVQEKLDDWALAKISPPVRSTSEILDGRNRYHACKDAGIELTEANVKTLSDGHDPIDFVRSNNIHRRHLSKHQLEMAAAELANMKRGAFAGNQNASKTNGPNGPLVTEAASVRDGTIPDPNGKAIEPVGKTEPAQQGQPLISQEAAAEKFGVSRRNVKRASAIMKADPELAKQVKGGKITTGAAERKVKAKQTKGKPLPKAVDASLEHEGTPGKDLTAQLEPCFKALWQLSVDLQKSEVRDWADKIERALEKKGYVPASERQRDSKGYLARIKPKPVEAASTAGSVLP